MRMFRIEWLLVLALVLGAAHANASSVDVIWHGSGTGTTTVAPGATGIVGDIVIRIGVADAPITGVFLGASATGTVSMTGSTQNLPEGWIDLGPMTASGSHTNNVISMGDLFLSGAVFEAGTSGILGTVTVNAGAGGGSVAFGGDDGNGFYDDSRVFIFADEFSFGGGSVNVPEPTTAGLLGLGLLALSLAQRNRRQ